MQNTLEATTTIVMIKAELNYPALETASICQIQCYGKTAIALTCDESTDGL
jgi:hypothetical protein